MTLDKLKTGARRPWSYRFNAPPCEKTRIYDLGLTEGTEILAAARKPRPRTPWHYWFRGSLIAFRRRDSAKIEVEKL